MIGSNCTDNMPVAKDQTGWGIFDAGPVGNAVFGFSNYRG